MSRNAAFYRLIALIGVIVALGVLPTKADTVYDNTENESTSYLSYNNGGASSASGTAYTYLAADDLTYAKAKAGETVTSIEFSVANENDSAASVDVDFGFWNSDGTSGGPGTILKAFQLSPVSLGADDSSLFLLNLSAAEQFVLPASGTIWAGIVFQNSTDTESAGTVNNFGQLLFKQPTVGSSKDEFFSSNNPGLFDTSNPAGSLEYFNGDPLANFGWLINADTVPEPSSWTMVLGGLGLLSFWRLRRAKV